MNVCLNTKALEGYAQLNYLFNSYPPRCPEPIPMNLPGAVYDPFSPPQKASANSDRLENKARMTAQSGGQVLSAVSAAKRSLAPPALIPGVSFSLAMARLYGFWMPGWEAPCIIQDTKGIALFSCSIRTDRFFLSARAKSLSKDQFPSESVTTTTA